MHIPILKKQALLIILILAVAFAAHSQKTTGFKIPDSLKGYSYQQLKEKYYSVYPDSIPTELYAKTYLQKSKNTLDTLHMAKGYHYLAHLYNNKLKLDYLDSIISVSNNLINEKYPHVAYIIKGKILHDQENFEQALETYLSAYENAKKNNSEHMQVTVKACIGVLKQRIGKNDEALGIFQECHNYFQRKKNNFFGYYLTNLFNLSTLYSKTKQLDSATKMNRLGYQESLRSNNNEKKMEFILNEGVNQFRLGNYNIAIDSIKKALPTIATIKNSQDFAIGYSFLGKAYFQLNKKDSAIFYLKKSDTLFRDVSKSIYPEVRDGYELLINHYKKIGDKNEQLKAIERLMELDETLVSDYRYLNETIVKKYDTPELLADKEQLIKKLHTKNVASFNIIIALGMAGVLFLLCIAYYYNKQRTYKKKFLELMQQTVEPFEKETITKHELQLPARQKESLNISEEVIQDISKRLQSFEKGKEFLDAKLTAHLLANRMGTNVKYLSKVINHNKEKKFNEYLSSLRINYAIEQLKTDKKLQNYTIKAIASQMGFNNAQSFSLAFLKQTGIYPSYFIKQLQNSENKIITKK